MVKHSIRIAQYKDNFDTNKSLPGVEVGGGAEFEAGESGVERAAFYMTVLISVKNSAIKSQADRMEIIICYFFLLVLHKIV